MQLTSFTKTLLGIGAGVAVVGGGAGLLVARHQRKENAETAYRATPVTVDEFVDTTFAAFDTHSYPSPFEPFDDYANDFREPDGKLQVGAEDVLSDDQQFFPELVSIDGEDSYYRMISGREFMQSADQNADGTVTREELTTAVTPYAGDDGKLDEAERRGILTDGGLAKVIDDKDWKSITGWKSNSVMTAYEAASSVLRGYRWDDEELQDGGSPAVRIADVAPDVPWVEQGTRLGSGEVTSVKPAMAKIDAAGNGNGLLSVQEVAAWLVEHHGDESLVHGHVAKDPEFASKVLKPQSIARIEADTLAGKIYYDDELPKADVDRFYGGSVPNYLDAVKGFQTFRGDAAWQPDPDPAT